jgi:hypothetical protein
VLAVANKGEDMDWFRGGMILFLAPVLIKGCGNIERFLRRVMFSVQASLLAQQARKRKLHLNDFSGVFLAGIMEIDMVVIRHEDVVVEQYEFGKKVLAMQCSRNARADGGLATEWGVLPCPHDGKGNRYPVGEFERHPIVDEVVSRGVLMEVKPRG